MLLRRSLLAALFVCFAHAGLAANAVMVNVESAISATQGPYYPLRPSMEKKAEQLVVYQEGCPNLNLFLDAFNQFGTFAISSTPSAVAIAEFFATYSDSKFTKACHYPVDFRYHMVARIVNKTSSPLQGDHLDKDIYGHITGSFSINSAGVTNSLLTLLIDAQTQNIALPLPSSNSGAPVLFNVDGTAAATNFNYLPSQNTGYIVVNLSVFID